MSWTPIIGKAFSVADFGAYVASLGLPKQAWKPSFIVLHNTGSPNLSQRPQGLTRQHIANLETYYRDQNKWSAGPHLFVDDHQIWVFTPLTHPGVHSPSWNSLAWGIEMLGDYSVDNFRSGRGSLVRTNAIGAIEALMQSRQLKPSSTTLRLHNEDPKTTHRDCPGKTVVKAEILAALGD